MVLQSQFKCRGKQWSWGQMKTASQRQIMKLNYKIKLSFEIVQPLQPWGKARQKQYSTVLCAPLRLKNLNWFDWFKLLWITVCICKRSWRLLFYSVWWTRLTKIFFKVIPNWTKISPTFDQFFSYYVAFNHQEM